MIISEPNGLLARCHPNSAPCGRRCNICRLKNRKGGISGSYIIDFEHPLSTKEPKKKNSQRHIVDYTKTKAEGLPEKQIIKLETPPESSTIKFKKLTGSSEKTRLHESFNSFGEIPSPKKNEETEVLAFHSSFSVLKKDAKEERHRSRKLIDYTKKRPNIPVEKANIATMQRKNSGRSITKRVPLKSSSSEHELLNASQATLGTVTSSGSSGANHRLKLERCLSGKSNHSLERAQSLHSISDISGHRWRRDLDEDLSEVSEVSLALDEVLCLNSSHNRLLASEEEEEEDDDDSVLEDDHKNKPLPRNYLSRSSPDLFRRAEVEPKRIPLGGDLSRKSSGRVLHMHSSQRLLLPLGKKIEKACPMNSKIKPAENTNDNNAAPVRGLVRKESIRNISMRNLNASVNDERHTNAAPSGRSVVRQESVRNISMRNLNAFVNEERHSNASSGVRHMSMRNLNAFANDERQTNAPAGRGLVRKESVRNISMRNLNAFTNDTKHTSMRNLNTLPIDLYHNNNNGAITSGRGHARNQSLRNMGSSMRNLISARAGDEQLMRQLYDNLNSCDSSVDETVRTNTTTTTDITTKKTLH